jgi:hypothetical protein
LALIFDGSAHDPQKQRQLLGEDLREVLQAGNSPSLSKGRIGRQSGREGGKDLCYPNEIQTLPAPALFQTFDIQILERS